MNLVNFFFACTLVNYLVSCLPSRFWLVIPCSTFSTVLLYAECTTDLSLKGGIRDNDREAERNGGEEKKSMDVGDFVQNPLTGDRFRRAAAVAPALRRVVATDGTTTGPRAQQLILVRTWLGSER